jgi:AraC-like DNA-binding protein
MIARRETRLLPDGRYVFQDELHITGVVTARIVTCQAWLLELYVLRSGDVFCMKGETPVHAGTSNVAIFYPPFSIVRPCFQDLEADVLGIAGTSPLPPGVSPVPLIFDCNRRPEIRPIADILRGAQNPKCVDANPNASSLSMKARKMIAEARSTDPSIARIALRLGVSNAHLSRQFKRDYAMSPREYLHHVRIADVPMQLAKGRGIAEVSLGSGYRDLSRFYKQFSKATRSSPGRCRKMLSPTRTR